ncbi:hypothetical protein [Geomicrobium sp. JCM 19055]|uniref:hypothetical protein n=1 Tax=Geomicrobium sp. JCM 19055 TaxID=1460649 RepID=UPI0022368918|nr:hypothetical protein [Geomicrobium sp. JCM 19055]
MNKRIGITLGDASGIGPELVVKAFQNEEVRTQATWIIAGDKEVLEHAQMITGKKNRSNIHSRYKRCKNKCRNNLFYRSFYITIRIVFFRKVITRSWKISG